MSIRHHMAPDKRVDVLFAERWRALVNEQWDTWWATMTAPGVPSAWETLEAAVTDVVRHHGQQLMEPLAVVPAPRPCWAVGQAPLRQVDPAHPITVTGLWGEYHLTRAYYVCPAGHGSATPADAAWGLGRAHVTPALAAHLCRLVVERPFDRAAAMAQELLGVAVDGETLRRLAEGVGQVAETTAQTAPAAVAAGHVPEPTGPGPAGLLVALDGAMVHPDGAWHEVPVGVCQALEPRPVDGWEPDLSPVLEFDYCRNRKNCERKGKSGLFGEVIGVQQVTAKEAPDDSLRVYHRILLSARPFAEVT
ncbi:MAG: hypothetical protein OWU33_07560, partial [Firmicutes bacterium]|nr:hypothetical protein [Bacillota bacterium]